MEKKIEESLEIIKEELNNDNPYVIAELYDLIPKIENKKYLIKYSIPYEEWLIEDNNLDFSCRLLPKLIRAGFKKIGDIPLNEPEKLMKIKGFGLYSARELYDKLEAYEIIKIDKKLKQKLIKCRILNEDETKKPYGWHRK